MCNSTVSTDWTCHPSPSVNTKTPQQAMRPEGKIERMCTVTPLVSVGLVAQEGKGTPIKHS